MELSAPQINVKSLIKEDVMTQFRIGGRCVLPAVFAGAAFLGLFAQMQVFGNDRAQAPASTPESIAAGKAVFFEYCSGCHGRRADGRGPQSLNLVPRPQNLRNAQFVKYLTDERMYTSISGGVRGTAMPAFELTLHPEKRWNVIHYIRSLTAEDPIKLSNGLEYQSVAPGTKDPVTASGDAIARGKTLFLNYCSNCHGPKADGHGIISPNLTPGPRNLVVVTSWGEKPFIDYMPDSRLYESITNGVPGTSMSPWIKVMTDEERWSVITYLRDRAREERTNVAQQ
jgi:mono/diheme cytochrome c family protein